MDVLVLVKHQNLVMSALNAWQSSIYHSFCLPLFYVYIKISCL